MFRKVWEGTIHKYLINVCFTQTECLDRCADRIGDCRILIISHDMLSFCIDKLLAKSFGVLIIDESQTFTDYKNKCTKAAMTLAKKAQRVILLSEIPDLSIPSELFIQLSMIDHNFFGGFTSYARRYCDMESNLEVDIVSIGTPLNILLQELGVILKEHFMIRRTRDDVLESLNNKNNKAVALDITFSQKDATLSMDFASKYKNPNKTDDQRHLVLFEFFNETSRIKAGAVW